jgi:hypothetical protein
MHCCLRGVEAYHLQVGPGENVRELLADSFEDANSRQFLDALGECFLLALGLLLRRRLAAGHAIVNFAFVGSAEIENAASTLAVSENGGFRLWALPLRRIFRQTPRILYHESGPSAFHDSPHRTTMIWGCVQRRPAQN